MIKKSTAGLIERPEAILSELRFLKDKEKDYLLLVEGSTDVKVIKKFLKENHPKSVIRVLESKEYLESNQNQAQDSTKVSGKNNALSLFHKLKAQGRNVKCLLDRDWDLLTRKLSSNEHIFFYDYYELENYLLEKPILKKYINLVVESELTTEELLNLLILNLNELQQYMRCLLKIHFLKEADAVHRFLDTNTRDTLFAISNIKLAPILTRADIPGSNYIEKISSYTDDALRKLECSSSDLDDWTQTKIGLCLPVFSSPVDAFKYCIKGKDIPSIIYAVARKIVEENVTKRKFIGSANDLAKHFLYADWLLNDSIEFSTLISNIIDSYDKAS